MSMMKRWLETHCIECGEEVEGDGGFPLFCPDGKCFDKYLSKNPPSPTVSPEEYDRLDAEMPY